MLQSQVRGLAVGLLAALFLSSHSQASQQVLAPSSSSSSPLFACSVFANVTYHNRYGNPLFTEVRHSCEFASPPRLPPAAPTPLVAPAPYSHYTHAGEFGVDNMVLQLGRIEPTTETFQRELLQAHQKRTITSYGAELLPNASLLDQHKYSNLFYGLRSLTNQSCLEPGEAVEFVDVIERTWVADWRFTVVNRGVKVSCEWYQEVANVAEALHYFAFFLDLGVGRRSGGIEALAYGAGEVEEGSGDEGLLWCLRYSKRGWDEELFQEKCLGL